MVVKWTRPEVRSERGSNGVTLAEIEQLVMAARMAGAPDDALLGIDVKMEIRTPAHAVRATFEWPD